MAMYYQGVKSNSYGASASDSDTIFSFQTVTHGGDIGPNISVASIDSGSVSNMNTNGASTAGYRMNIDVQLNGTWYTIGYITVSGQTSSHQTFSNFTDAATAEVKSLMGKVAPAGLRGNVVAGYFHANAGSVLNINATTKVDTSPVTPPTALSLSTTLSEGSVTLSGSGAGAGVSNSITGYQLQYRDSADGANWGAWTGYDTVSTSSGSFSYSVSPSGTRGYYRQFRARTIGVAGEAYYSDWKESSNTVRKNRSPIAPASTTASPSLYESGNVTVSWPAGSDPDGGTLTYNVYYVYSGGSWVHFATTQNLSTTFTPSIERGSWVAFFVTVVDPFGVSASGPTSNTVYRNRAPISPASITASPSLFESGNIAISWPAGSDPDGNLSYYIVQYTLSSDGVSDGAWTQLTSTGGLSATHTPTLNRGSYIRYRIWSVDSLDVSSAPVYSNWVKRNQLPIAPASISVSPTLYEGGNVTVSWPAGSDPDGNLSNYTVECSYSTSPNTTSWGEWLAVSTTSSLNAAHSPSIARGYYIKYRVRSNDALGASSGFVESGAVRKNQIPATPAWVLPIANGTTHGASPSIRVAIPAEPDGQTQTLQLSVDGGAYINIASNVSASGATITHVVPLATGTHTLSIRTADSLGAVSDSASRTITVASPSWTRAITPSTVISNEIISHRADITELLARINTVRVFYGLANASLPGTVGKWADWRGQMQALQTALGACFTAIGKTVPSWHSVPVYPTASIINQLRTEILNV